MEKRSAEVVGQHIKTKRKEHPERSTLNTQDSVSYTMHVSPIGGKENATLSFREDYRRESGSRGLDGYIYSFNGRSYQDVESLYREPVEDVFKNVQITTDIHGEKVLKTYTQIPTFDSGDREWDSAEIEFLMFDGRDIHLIVMRGGYSIAHLTFYEKLLTADARMKPIFEKLGWPVDNITWV